MLIFSCTTSEDVIIKANHIIVEIQANKPECEVIIWADEKIVAIIKGKEAPNSCTIDLLKR